MTRCQSQVNAKTISRNTCQDTIPAAGDVCLRCHSERIIEQRVIQQEDSRYQEMQCDGCGFAWTNVWVITHMLVFNDDGDPEIYASDETTASLPIIAERSRGHGNAHV